MKLFEFINKGEIHVAAGSKVIKAKEFSQLLNAKELLKKVQEDAIEYKKQVVNETEKLKEQAEQEGFKAGIEQWAQQVAFLEEEIKKVDKGIEDVVVPLALSAAKKIIGKELEMSPTAVVDIVANNLKAVSEHRKITVYVNRKDLPILEENKTRLEKIFGRLESLSIKERDDVEQNGCIIETEMGIINAQLHHQWLALEKAFENIMKTQQ